MKIAILSRYQNTVYRGVESVVQELSSRLSKNHQVDVFAGKDSDLIFKVIRGNYDIVMPMNGRLQSLKASWSRLLGGYKLVIGGHSGIGKDDIFNITVAKPDVFIALTDYMATWAKKWAWGSKVIKIPDGVDLDKFKPEGEKIKIDLPKPVILSVGALVWYKHHEKIIEAAARMGNASLLIVGKGGEEQRLKELGKKKLGKRFKVIQVPYEEMPKVYHSCDIFTLPSWDREAFGVVYLEAMASGISVVAPDDLSRREIVGQAGVLTNVDDPNQYAQALKQALDKNWANLPEKQAEKFSWDKVAQSYELCFQELLKN